MKTEVTMTILERLIEGVHPITGELLPEDHVCREGDVIDALRHALACVAREEDAPEEAKYIRKNGKLNAGRPWTREDDEELLALMRQGLTAEEIAPMTQRRKRGVQNRMQFLDTGRYPERGPFRNSGQPWHEEDDLRLRQMYVKGASIAELAAAFERSELSIRYRLDHLGLVSLE